MKSPAKIVIVEKDIPLAARLSLKLDRLGFKITGIFSRAKDALIFIKQEVPDAILLDDQLKGELNGMESANSKTSKSKARVIYFNKSSADALDEKLKKSLNANKKALKEGFRRSIQKLQEKSSPNNNGSIKHYILKDRIFIRDREKMVKITLDDIKFIEADRNYCKVFSKHRNYLLVTILKEFDEKLKDNRFLRIHRSYIVNLAHIDEIGKDHVVISSRSLPLSKNLKAKLFEYLQVI